MKSAPIWLTDLQGTLTNAAESTAVAGWLAAAAGWLAAAIAIRSAVIANKQLKLLKQQDDRTLQPIKVQPTHAASYSITESSIRFIVPVLIVNPATAPNSLITADLRIIYRGPNGSPLELNLPSYSADSNATAGPAHLAVPSDINPRGGLSGVLQFEANVNLVNPQQVIDYKIALTDAANTEVVYSLGLLQAISPNP